jgi:hypothetical protein
MQKVIFSAFFALGALLVRLVLLVLPVFLARRPLEKKKGGHPPWVPARISYVYKFVMAISFLFSAAKVVIY